MLASLLMRRTGLLRTGAFCERHEICSSSQHMDADETSSRRLHRLQERGRPPAVGRRAVGSGSRGDRGGGASVQNRKNDDTFRYRAAVTEDGSQLELVR